MINSPNSSRSGNVLGPILFLIVGICSTGYSADLWIRLIRDYRESTQLREEGVIADGVVTDVHSTERSDSTAYYVAYRYSPVGIEREFSGQQQISDWTYGRLNVGMAVTVRYLKNTPEVSRLGMDPHAPTVFSLWDPVLSALLGVPFLLLGLGGVFRGWHSE